MVKYNIVRRFPDALVAWEGVLPEKSEHYETHRLSPVVGQARRNGRAEEAWVYPLSAVFSPDCHQTPGSAGRWGVGCWHMNKQVLCRRAVKC